MNLTPNTTEILVETPPGIDRSGWTPFLAAVGIVGLILSPLLVGIEPIGWDPDLLYRPIKGELAAALKGGGLPYWSDKLGLGVPLVAESHAAAFYPPNWIAYRFLGVHAAYRLLMWAHFVACAAATYAYARSLSIGPWGSALAGVAFTLGGFQAAHACHEPFYTLLPYLPLSLLMAERYLATGRAAWLAGLALAWGTQLLLGHFQIQMWTGGLVLLTGCARAIAGRTSWRLAARLAPGLAWGLAVASVQLLLTSELTRVSEFDRPKASMLSYGLTPGHLAQWALPAVYRVRHVTPMHGPMDEYWNKVDTTPEESTTYIGVTALVLACVGLAGVRRSGAPGGDLPAAVPMGSGAPRRATHTEDPSPPLRGPSPRVQGEGRPPMPRGEFQPAPGGLRSEYGQKVAIRPDEEPSEGDPMLGAASASLSIWLWISLAATVLATMPRWWPEGYTMLLKVPGLGWFRAPSRYMLLPNLGIALLAGRGLDRGLGRDTIRRGLLLALALGIAALAWSLWHVGNPLFREVLGASTLPGRYALAIGSWGLAAGAVLAWRGDRAGAWLPLGAAAIELAALFYSGPTLWGREIAFPASSPILTKLKQEQGIGLVAGRLQNLPIRLGLTVARPLLGINAPPPANLLEPSCYWLSSEITPVDTRWQRRFGVTHGVWAKGDVVPGVDVIAEGPDDVLSELLETGRPSVERDRWRLVRYRDAFPNAWVATRARQASGWGPLYSRLAYADLMDEAWFLPEDRPQEARPDPRAAAYGMVMGAATETDIDLGPPATSAKVVEWDGRSGTVEHDGSCVLIVRRAYYPGWRARIDDGPEKPVSRVGYNLQGVVLTGRGPSRIALGYRPSRLGLGMTLSTTAIAAAFVTLGMAARRTRPSGRMFIIPR